MAGTWIIPPPIPRRLERKPTTALTTIPIRRSYEKLCFVPARSVRSTTVPFVGPPLRRFFSRRRQTEIRHRRGVITPRSASNILRGKNAVVTAPTSAPGSAERAKIVPESETQSGPFLRRPSTIRRLPFSTQQLQAKYW